MSAEYAEMDAEVKLPVEEIRALAEADDPAQDETVQEGVTEEAQADEPEHSEDAGEPQSKDTATKAETVIAEAQGKAVQETEVEEERQQEQQPQKDGDQLSDVIEQIEGKLKAEGFDPDLIEAIKSVGNVAQDALKRAEAAEQAIGQSRQVVEHERTVNWFDSKLAAAGGDFQDMFGKGTYKDIPQGGEQFKARAALFDDMASLLKGNSKLTMEEAFDKAFKAMTYDVAQQKQKAKLTTQAKKRDSQTMEPPGNKGSDVSLDADAEALSEVKSILAKAFND
jgi:hypothetical protein